jgi:hypothetical protein
VANPPGRVIENLGRRERLVTTLVRENPKSSSEEPLDDSI